MHIAAMRRGQKQHKKNGGYRVNKDVVAPEVRLIDETGKAVGVMSSRQALEMAEDKGLDLIEIAPTAKPPTCKIMDFGKWKYENQKKDKESRKRQTIVVIKEVQFRPRTEEHDLNVKLRNARKFLLDGNKVKANLRFSGREMAHQEQGLKLLQRVIKLLDDVAVVETNPKREGRQMFVLFNPDPAKIKEYKKEKERLRKLEEAGGQEALKADAAEKTAEAEAQSAE